MTGHHPSDVASAGDTAPGTAADGQVTGVPSDNTTLLAVLDELQDDGYDASFGARDGARLFCSQCRERHPVERFEIDATRRLEGASDPDAEVLVVAGTCPACGARGTAALGYGPEAGAADAEVVAALDLHG